MPRVQQEKVQSMLMDQKRFQDRHSDDTKEKRLKTIQIQSNQDRMRSLIWEWTLNVNSGQCSL